MAKKNPELLDKVKTGRTKTIEKLTLIMKTRHEVDTVMYLWELSVSQLKAAVVRDIHYHHISSLKSCDLPLICKLLNL